MKTQKLLVMIAVIAALVGATTYAQAADIGLTKGVTPQSPNIYRPGDTIHYVMTVTNLHGSENIEITQVEDLLPDGTLIQMDNSTDPAYPALPYILGAGATQTYLLDWVIPLGTSGYVINDLRCVGVQYSTVPDNFDAHVQKTSLVIDPCIEVTKEVDCDISKLGDEVTYHICVTNCGDTDLLNLTVIDDVIGDLAAYFPSGLVIGETACADVPYVIQGGDADPLVNTVTVTAEDLTGYSVSDYATEEVDLIHPSVEVVKECLTPQVPAGGNADFGITINNTGDCTLIVTTTEADMAGPYTILAGGFYYDMVTYPDPGGVDCVYNEVTVTWTLPAEYCEMDNTGTAWDEACCDVVNPCIAVTKVVDCDISKVGDEVIYHICVTNCSDPEAPLYNLTVIDDVIGDLAIHFPAGLAGGETACAYIPYVIQADDPDPLVNTVTVTAENAAGTAVSDYATEEVDLIHPSVEVFKECLTDPVSPGGDADFGITINNTGDCTLIVTTTETEIPGPLTILAGASYTDTVTRTDPGGVDCVYNDITVTWTLPAEYCEMDNTGTAWAEACCPIEGGEEGCTPGFWKNHHDCWCDAYDPEDRVDSVFTVPSELSELADDTLYDALQYGGGKDVIGAARNLLRSAVSALLNACSSDIAYPMSVAGVIADVNAALATLDRGEILGLHFTLDTYNNYGCSIDAHCRPIVDPDKGGLLEDHGAGEILTPSENKEILSTVAWSRSVPNPFSDNTRIQFYLPTGGSVAVDVYDVSGRHVASLLNDQRSAGSHEVVWNGRSSHDDPAPAGVYFYTLRLDNETLMKKIMLVR